MPSKPVSLLIGIILGTVFSVVYFLYVTDVSVSHTIVEISEIPEDDKAAVLYWEKRIKEVGGREAYAILLDTYKEYPKIEQHFYGHLFGEALYKVVGTSGVVVCDDRFSFGCHHSFFGTAIIDRGLPVITELDQVCMATYGENGRWCQHGIGHGIIAELGRDQLQEALDACATLNWLGPIGGCAGGVFMEYNFQNVGDNTHRQYIEGNAHYPCDVISENFQTGCYFEQPVWWFSDVKPDSSFAGEECAKVIDTESREACFHGAGNAIAGRTFADVPYIINECGEMSDREGEMLCIEGAAWHMSGQPDAQGGWMELCEPLEGVFYERCVASKDLI